MKKKIYHPLLENNDDDFFFPLFDYRKVLKKPNKNVRIK